MMVSIEGVQGVPSSARIWYLDWLDANDVPHSEDLPDRYAGFKKLGADGWKLVQGIEHPASEGFDGPIPADTTYYFTRPARARG